MTEILPEERRLYASVDTGFIGRNVYLFCASVGLATVFRGSFDFPKLTRTLKLPDQQFVTFAQTVGYPPRVSATRRWDSASSVVVAARIIHGDGVPENLAARVRAPAPAYYTLPTSGFAARIATERITSVKIFAGVISIFLVSQLCSAAEPFGEFVELHSCDLYTGGCTASAESTLLGRQVFRAWSIESGAWNGQDLTHLKVAVLETGSRNLAEKGALGDRAEIFVPRDLSEAKREALVSWAAAQHPLPRGTPVIEAEIVYKRSRQEAVVTVGDTVSLTTMAIGRCSSGACGQSLWYEPQVDHSAFEVVASRTSKIRDATLFWADHDRPNVFLASFGPNPNAGQLAD